MVKRMYAKYSHFLLTKTLTGHAQICEEDFLWAYKQCCVLILLLGFCRSMILQAESKREYEEVCIIPVKSFVPVSFIHVLKDIVTFSSMKVLLACLSHAAIEELFEIPDVCWAMDVSLILSSVSHLQWICTLNNISRQIYLTDNPEVQYIYSL